MKQLVGILVQSLTHLRDLPGSGRKATYFKLDLLLNLCCMKDVLYEVRCLKSNEDMILALTGQFKQLSHEPEK